MEPKKKIEPITYQGITYTITPSETQEGLWELTAPPRKHGWLKRVNQEDIQHSANIMLMLLDKIKNQNYLVLKGNKNLMTPDIDNEVEREKVAEKLSEKLELNLIESMAAKNYWGGMKLQFSEKDRPAVEEMLRDIIEANRDCDLPKTYTLSHVVTSVDHESKNNSTLPRSEARRVNQTPVNVTLSKVMERGVCAIEVEFDLGYNDEKKPTECWEGRAAPKFKYTTHKATSKSESKLADAQNLSEHIQRALANHKIEFNRTASRNDRIDFSVEQRDQTSANFTLLTTDKDFSHIAGFLKQHLEQKEKAEMGNYSRKI